MRRSRRVTVALSVAAMAFATLAAGCSSSSEKAATTPPSVTANFGAQPTITMPKGSAPGKTISQIVHKGDGQPVASGDLVVVDDYGRTWDKDTPFEDSFTDGRPYTLPQGLGALMPGLDKAFIGTPVGSRVLLVLPPDQALGDKGAPDSGIGKNDTLVLVFDLLGAYPAGKGVSGTMTAPGGNLPTVKAQAGKEPTITIPSGEKPPAKLSSTVLIKGEGKTVGKGDLAVVQYTGVIWRTGKVFDSSWAKEVPASFPVGVGNLIEGWDETIVGAHVGDRLLLIVPPDKGYGPKGGSPDVGIEKDDTLVFVVDILGTFPTTK